MMEAYSDAYFSWGWLILTILGVFVTLWSLDHFITRWKWLAIWLVVVSVLGGLALRYREGFFT